ncbi:hypothetical protein MNV_560036 [Candidatus Methanoperedens nitroreducens]|uniref:Uncharacterized protein n=2 Tax=Candidatus Methanoperedens nitratireducens TaxID=1392998 RepID=A0A284VRT4_9EURY|nr:hypothetical protein MNV_560036 [Candidatus Methanoperedens nitroreducens]
MAACGFREKEPQINADERRYKPVTDFISFFNGKLFSVTDFGATHRKGCKKRKEKRLESLRSKYQPAPWLNAMMRRR